MLSLMFINRIQLKMQSESEDHLGITVSHHRCITKNKTMELISLFWTQQNAANWLHCKPISKQWQLKTLTQTYFTQQQVRNVITCQELIWLKFVYISRRSRYSNIFTCWVCTESIARKYYHQQSWYRCVYYFINGFKKKNTISKPVTRIKQ